MIMEHGGAPSLVTVNFLEGDLSFELTSADTVNDLRSKVASARGSFPAALTLLYGDSVLMDMEQHVLAIGTQFNVVIRETLGVDWKTMPPSMSQAPWAPGYGYAVTMQGDRLLVIGGVQHEYQGQDEGEFCDNAVWGVRPGCSWELLSRPPWKPRRFHGATVDASGRLLVFGGEDHRGTTFRDVWSFDGSVWQELGEVPWSKGTPDAAVGTPVGALVVVGSDVHEFTGNWHLRCSLPENTFATSCALVGGALYIGSYEGQVLIHSDDQWSTVRVPGDGFEGSYSMVSAGPAGQVFVYMMTDSEDKGTKGLGNVFKMEGCGLPRHLATAVIPRVIGEHERSETIGLQRLFQAWNGIGILSCCGHLVHSI